MSLLNHDPRSVIVGLWAISVPNKVSIINRITSFQKEIGPLKVYRAQIATRPDILIFDGVTLGDTVLNTVHVNNTGNADLIVTEILHGIVYSSDSLRGSS